MKIISQILLLSLIFVISCDKDSVSPEDEEEIFSIVGDWKSTQTTEDGGSNWTNISSNSYILLSYKSNGTYTVSTTATTSATLYYKLCESSNVLLAGSVSSIDDGNCDCEPTLNYGALRFETEGLNTMIWKDCMTENYGTKYIRQ